MGRAGKGTNSFIKDFAQLLCWCFVVLVCLGCFFICVCCLLLVVLLFVELARSKEYTKHSNCQQITQDVSATNGK